MYEKRESPRQPLFCLSLQQTNKIFFQVQTSHVLLWQKQCRQKGRKEVKIDLRKKNFFVFRLVGKIVSKRWELIFFSFCEAKQNLQGETCFELHSMVEINAIFFQESGGSRGQCSTEYMGVVKTDPQRCEPEIYLRQDFYLMFIWSYSTKTRTRLCMGILSHSLTILVFPSNFLIYKLSV